MTQIPSWYLTRLRADLMPVSAGGEQLRRRVQVWLQLSPCAALRAAGTLLLQPQPQPLQC